LAHAVRGFFENDGLLCYVVPLPHSAPAVDALRGGLERSNVLDGVDLVCAPDVMREASRPDVATMQREILEHCWSRGDRFAVLDGLPEPDPVKVETQRAGLAGVHGGFGALYYPWLAVPGRGSLPPYVPPCGHVAGAYSRSDQRVGVHKAPANEVIDGVLDLQVRLTEAQVGQLYAHGVNCLRALVGRGIRVWGARTLSDGPAQRDVNARRVLSTIGRWVERFMTLLVHEPNDVRLWVRIMREVAGYLDGLFQRGVLKGDTAEQAYFGGVNGFVHKLPGPATYANLVLSHGLTAVGTLWNWYDDTTKGVVQRRNGTIMLLNPRQIPVMWWNFRNALPVRWTGPTFNATSDEVGVEVLELVHEGLSTPLLGQAAALGHGAAGMAGR